MNDQGIIGTLRVILEEARMRLRTMRGHARDLPGANYRMGLQYLKEGNLTDAILRLRVATRLDPAHAEAWYELGRCRMGKGQYKEASCMLQNALKHAPQHAGAAFMLALIDPKRLPPGTEVTRMPEALVTELFTMSAPNYDAVETGRGYRGHVLVTEAAKAHLNGVVPENTLDIGCGTGLCGVGVRPLTSRLIGLDIAPAMAHASLARLGMDGEPAYDDTLTADIRSYLRYRERPVYGLMTAGKVAGYLGELETLMHGVKRSLLPGGLFVFTTDPWEGDGFGLDAERERFGHSDAYLKHTAQQAGLRVEAITRGEIYPGMSASVVVLRNPA